MKTELLRKRADTGRVYLREAMTVAFFFPPPICDAVDGLQRVLDLYLEAIPPGALTWSSIGASSEEWKPIDTTTLRRCRDQLKKEAAAKRRLTSFKLTDGEVGGDAPGYSIAVLGSPGGDTRVPDELCLLQMTFPMEALDAASVDKFIEFCRQVASLIPYVSGYASPGLQWAELNRGEAAEESMPIALRHPGYDVEMNEQACLRLGSRVRGARWLTFLGSELVVALGGRARLRSALSTPIDVEPSGSGSMIRASTLPEIGDVNKAIDGHGLREVAALLEPVTAFEESALLGNFANHDHDLLRRWERRLLN